MDHFFLSFISSLEAEAVKESPDLKSDSFNNIFRQDNKL